MTGYRTQLCVMAGLARGLAITVLAVGSVLITTPAGAAMLTFPNNICANIATCGDGSFISDTYGDVAGAVDISYRNLQGNPTLTRLRYWNNDYNDLVGVAWTDGFDVNSKAEIFIKPLNGKVVTLSAFDLGAFPDSQRTSQFTILDGDSNLLFNSGLVTIGVQPGNLHSHFSFTGLTTTNGIRIQWGPSAFNVGIDNINFTVSLAGDPIPVPVPPAGYLLTAALVMLARRRA